MVSVAARTGDRFPLLRAGVVLGSIAALTAAVAAGRGVELVAIAALVLGLALTVGRALTRWPVLVGGIVLIILFIPIRRYKLGANLPFDLEPYRIAVALVVAIWIGTMLVDRRLRLRRTFVDPPLMLFAVAVIGSIVTNASKITSSATVFYQDSFIEKGDVSGDVLKKVLFFGSFYLVFYLVTSVVRDIATVYTVLKTLVVGSTVLALSGIVEARTNYNLFDHLQGIVPLLKFQGAIAATDIARGGRLRVYASAEHPIALAALLVMMLPIAICIARHTGRKRWILCATIIGVGALATVSRTSVTMLAAVAVIWLWLRPKEMKKLWPLILPALVVVHIAIPGTIGGLKEAFFPSQGLVQDQTVYGGRVSSTRLKPEFDRIKANPVFGQGFGSRVTESGLRKNASVLDDEWLGTTSETGFAGLFAWLWFFGRFVKRTGKEAKRDRSSRGWLIGSFASAAAAYAIGMLTYDAFSFVQVTFVLFILAGLGAVALGEDAEGGRTRAAGWSRRLAPRLRGSTP